ncbi:MAG TPA: ABC transporter permease, partial [Vicinamibacterales bacterium]|nr:ABC transporter permease [Vicinamibacterales bacterium]
MLTDLKLAWRWLRNSPAYAIISVLTLALAIGANAAIFSVADAVLFRPLPYSDPDRLLTARMENRATGERFTLVAGDLVRAIHDGHTGVGEVARLEEGPVVTRPTPDGMETIAAAAVTANYFQVLGVRAHRGRIFAVAGEDAGARAAMLSYRAWRERFGGDDQIVGRPLVLGQRAFDIVGVLPPGFVFPSPIAGTPDLICLLEGSAGGRGTGAFYPVVRLEPGVTRAEAQSELEAIYRALETGRGGEETVPVFEDIRSVLHATGGPIMRYMLAGSLLLLLLGCANLANVVLARGRRRERQTGIRAALGASRVRLVRPVLLEAMALAAAGSIAALAVARVAFDTMIGSVPPEAYLGADVGVDRRVFVFTVLLGFTAAIVFGLAPAWFSARKHAQRLIQRGAAAGARRAVAGSSLVAAQAGIAIVLVFGASIAGRAFLTLVREPIGFMPDDVLTVNLAVTGQRGAALQDLYLRVIEEVSREPGVRAAGATSSLPRIRESAWAAVYRPGTQDIVASHVHALPGYFEAARIPVIAGRPYTTAEVRAGALVAVVSERAA